MSLLIEAFNAIDSDHSGSISSHEIGDLLKGMGTRATIEELDDMVREERESMTRIFLIEILNLASLNWE